MDFDNRLQTLTVLTDYFSWPDNNGHNPDNESMLIHCGVLYWVVFNR